jgi:hypothetical protein
VSPPRPGEIGLGISKTCVAPVAVGDELVASAEQLRLERVPVAAQLVDEVLHREVLHRTVWPSAEAGHVHRAVRTSGGNLVAAAEWRTCSRGASRPAKGHGFMRLLAGRDTPVNQCSPLPMMPRTGSEPSASRWVPGGVSATPCPDRGSLRDRVGSRREPGATHRVEHARLYPFSREAKRHSIRWIPSRPMRRATPSVSSNWFPGLFSFVSITSVSSVLSP